YHDMSKLQRARGSTSTRRTAATRSASATATTTATKAARRRRRRSQRQIKGDPVPLLPPENLDRHPCLFVRFELGAEREALEPAGAVVELLRVGLNQADGGRGPRLVPDADDVEAAVGARHRDALRAFREDLHAALEVARRHAHGLADALDLRLQREGH